MPTSGPSQLPTPHAFYEKVWLKLIAALHNGTKHYSNGVGVIHMYFLS